MSIQNGLQSQPLSPIRGLYTIAESYSHAEAFLKGGAKIVQLRIKKDETRAWAAAKEISLLKRRYDFTFILNDYVEIAKEVGADGVHVGADDLSIAEVHKIVGSQMLIGYSSHALEEAVAAEKAGADYVAFGAIFPTKTKGPGHPVQGLEKLRAVVQAVKVPVVAIGGINKTNIDTVLQTGVAAVAMISALIEAEEIADETRSYHCRF